VLTFLAGAFLGRIGDRMGAKTRAWLVLGTFIQALFTMAAALAIWRSGSASISDARSDIAWTNAKAFVALGFISASLGLQGIMGKRVNTQFATTSASPLPSSHASSTEASLSRPYDRLVRAHGGPEALPLPHAGQIP
jgi:MFS family permease